MLNLFRIPFLAVFCVISLASTPIGAIGAQKSESRVQLVVPDSFPSQAGRAIVMRFADGQRSDVVLVNRSALSARTVAAAMALLRSLRRQIAEPPHDMLTLVDGFVEMPGANAHEIAGWERALDRLRAQKPSNIGNLGRGQWIELPSALVAR
jgi:hypothetical protein